MKRAFFIFTISFALGFVFLSILCLLAHESPVRVIQIVIDNSVIAPEDLSVTLFYATHLMFASAGLCVAFQAGLFPIGVEGQITLGTIATAVAGLLLGPGPLGFIAAIVIGPLVAALLGYITAFFKARKGAHEVIVTMMLNFICAGIANYLVANFFQSTTSQNPETTSLSPAFHFFAPLFADRGSPANVTFFLALAACVATWVLIYRTRFGFELRTVGVNPTVAAHSGISEKKIFIAALVISAALSGFCAWNQVLGYNLKYQVGVASDYGLLAIVVALIAGRNPLFAIPASLFFAILFKGASALDIETDTITRDFVKIIEAFLILAFLLAQKLDYKKFFRGGHAKQP